MGEVFQLSEFASFGESHPLQLWNSIKSRDMKSDESFRENFRRMEWLMGNGNSRHDVYHFLPLVLAGIVVRRLQSTCRLREQETSCERCSCNIHGAMDAAESYCRECKWFINFMKAETDIA